MSERSEVGSLSAMEERIAAIWSEVLGVRVTGPEDDFLVAGGDSLQAMKVLARVLKLFSVEVAITSFFSAPTVSQLASLVERSLIDAIEMLSDEDARRLVKRDGTS